MKRQLKYRHVEGTVEHDDQVSEATIRANTRYFFATPHGRRETFTFYRGGIIVRNTKTYSNNTTERWTAVYLFFPNLGGQADILHVGDTTDGINTVAKAKRFIDRILETWNIGCNDAK